MKPSGIITSPSTHRREENPNIVIRYLDKSNQIAVDTDDRETRDALLTLMQLPINGESTRFQAYEALQRDQIRGVIHNAGGMASEQLMMNLHCRACEIISARPIGARGTAVVTFKGTRLPYKIGLKSFTIRVYPFKSQVYACETCHKLGHGKQQCPNFKNPRCSVCGRKQHDSDEACPNKVPKCRNCGGQHLATTRDCPERVKINQQLRTKFTSRQKRSQQPLKSKPHVQERPQKAATLRHSFYTGPRSAPSTESAPGHFDHDKQTLANVVKTSIAVMPRLTRKRAMPKLQSRLQQPHPYQTRGRVFKFQLPQSSIPL
ncbi:hypothetical protein HPB50_026628 [Hyalomma asiaticum]|uniref:Uncharacterized protein n=1 Tax=Hyalomma asiaticum TaxID=266040 RepID=A0ACB7S076_HYAAI|nr:hypothetical protein HPB50_026628 [Hyalomma asiaticum]